MLARHGPMPAPAEHIAFAPFSYDCRAHGRTSASRTRAPHHLFRPCRLSARRALRVAQYRGPLLRAADAPRTRGADRRGRRAGGIRPVAQRAARPREELALHPVDQRRHRPICPRSLARARHSARERAGCQRRRGGGARDGADAGAGAAVAAGAAERVAAQDHLLELLPQADFAALTCPLTPQTELLFGAAAFAAIKPSAFLVNVARGRVVDEPALIRALQEGRIAGAALDCFWDEPLPADSPLWTFPSVLVTPHSAGETRRYEDNVIDLLLENLGRLWRGEDELKNQVV